MSIKMRDLLKENDNLKSNLNLYRQRMMRKQSEKIQGKT